MKAKTAKQAAPIAQETAPAETKEEVSTPNPSNPQPRRSNRKARLQDVPEGSALKSYSERYYAFQKEKERSTRATSVYWAELFGEEELPDCSKVMLDLKIGYELLHRGHVATGRAMAPKFLTNYAAAQELNPKKFDETLRQLVMVEIMEEDKMKTNNIAKGKALAAGGHAFKRSAGKTLGLGIGETWVKLFSNNEKLPRAKKLTDKQISAFMFAEFPDKKSAIFNAVSTVRSRIRRGVKVGGVEVKFESFPYDEQGMKIVAKKAAPPAAKPSKGEALAAPKKLTLKASKKAAPAAEEEVA